MPRLLASVEAEFDTDFAMLNSAQPGAIDGGGTFATSIPGGISMTAGSKYSRIHIRAERWDERPPLIDGWEDVDEIPFESIATGGLLELRGFDLEGQGLEIADLGVGRAQVFARGRHRYSYSSHPETHEMAPEEWLVRLFPQQGSHDPMAGGPRRIAGEGGMAVPESTPWITAVRGLQKSGWDSVLSGSQGFYQAGLALGMLTAAPSRLELASAIARWMPPYEFGGPDSESLELPVKPMRPEDRDPLAESAGREVITVGDAIDALISLGILVVESRGGVEMMIVNPSPEPAWERLNFTDKRLEVERSRALRSPLDPLLKDLQTALGWTGSVGLTFSPREAAIRWSAPVLHICDVLRVVATTPGVTTDVALGFDDDIDADRPITLRFETPRW